MNKSILNIINAIAICVYLTACGSSIPQGSDPAVKELVMQIAKDKLTSKMLPEVCFNATGIPLELLGDNLTYKQLQAKAANDADAKKIVAGIKSRLAKIKRKLTKVKTIKVDEQAGKSLSSAEMIVGKDKMPIRYTAELNKDGKLYVEVSGIKDIQLPMKTPDLSGVKALPLSEAVENRLIKFQSDLRKVNYMRRNEFESSKDYAARVRNAKINLYKQLFKEGIARKTYELDCRTGQSLRYSVDKATMYYYSVYESVLTASYNLSINYLPWKNKISLVEMDFAGMKTIKNRIPMNYKFKCPITEAKKLRTKFNADWQFDIKIWFRFDVQKWTWVTVKIFIIPKK
jgi:hypothetical protein